MPLSVQHLNADSTFLLTFYSSSSSASSFLINSNDAFSQANTRATTPSIASSKFTVLIDPWLAGSSSVWTPRFQISHHTSPPLITSLAQMPLPNVIVISQDKPDHCHEETLRTLAPDSPITIVAVPAAAKKIRSWRYFTHAKIISLSTYDANNPETVYREFLASDSHDMYGRIGEVTISYVPQRLDMTGLHNAIAITFTPPTSTDPYESMKSSFEFPFTRTTAFPFSPPKTPPLSTCSKRSDESFTISEAFAQTGKYTRYNQSLTPTSSISDESISNYGMTASNTNRCLIRPLSVLYSPHGISPSHLTSFMTCHLAPLNALPLTLLFHSITQETNPWFLGGKVVSGLPGGLEVAKRWGARNWISAHDEEKDTTGLAIRMLKSKRLAIEEAQHMVNESLGEDDKNNTRESPCKNRIDSNSSREIVKRVRESTKLWNLGVGERLIVGYD